MRLLTYYQLLGCCLFALFSLSSLHAQLAIKNNIPVIVNTNDTLSSAWGGGINDPVWGQMRINDDTLLDIVIFDSWDNTFIPFINQGGSKPLYQYAPQYYSSFKDCNCEYWARFKDYDHDGDMDIFCSNNSNVSLYTNTPQNGVAQISLAFAELDAVYFGRNLSLFSSRVFLPDFLDIDGDGDLDFLTWPAFTRNSPELYINRGVDSFGNADTMALEFITDCWGHFFEDGSTGLVGLHDTVSCPLINFNPRANGCFSKAGKRSEHILGLDKHTGGTNLLLDMDGDKITDLLLGDIGVPSIVYVHNCGTKDYAYIDTAYVDFPAYDTPVDLMQNPGLTYFDFDNDGIRDLMVGTYDANDEFSENKDPVMWYKNIGVDEAPVFSFRQKGVVSDRMEDLGRYSKPCFMDVNADGLQDMIVGNGGIFDRTDSSFSYSLALYTNVGNADRAAYQLTDSDFLNTASNPYVFPAPTPGDIDNDGDMDLLIGQQSGEIAFYENTAGAGQPATFTLKKRAYQGIDAGASSAPFLYDLDGDQDLDLLVGHSLGGIAFYRNIGTTTDPDFLQVTDRWGFFNVRDRFDRPNLGADAVPLILDIDNDNTPELLVGTRAGNVEVYEGVDIALLDTLVYTGNLLGFDFGSFAAPATAVLDSSGNNTFVVGIGRGGFMLANTLPDYEIPIDLTTGTNDNMIADAWELSIYPNPTNATFEVSREDAPGIVHAQLYDAMGKIVSAKKALPLGRTSFSLDGQPAGLYLLTVSNGTHSKTMKVIKQ